MTPKQILGKNLYTVLEVSELLELSIVTIRHYIHSGKIETIKLGNRYYIDEQTLNKLVEPQKLGGNEK
jgi:excisionase family DNA binding protein